MIGAAPYAELVTSIAMVPRPRDFLEELRSAKDRVKTLKAIKNQVIGNKTRKVAFIREGAIQQVLEVLRECTQDAGDLMELVQQQAAVVLGSLTYGTEAGLRELVAHHGLALLVEMLHSSDHAVVEAGLRAIKMLLQQTIPLPSYLTPTATTPALPAESLSLSLDASSLSSLLPASITTASSPTAAAALRLDAAALAAVVCCLQRSLKPPHSIHPATTTTSVMMMETSPPVAPGAPGAGSGIGSAPSSSFAVAAAAIGTEAPGGGVGGPNGSLAALVAAVLVCCCRREQERDLAISAGAPGGLLRLLAATERPDTLLSCLEGLSLTLPLHPPSCETALSAPEVTARLLEQLRSPLPGVRLLAAGCVATLSRAPGCTQSEALQRAALPVLLRLLVHPATRPHVPALLARLIEGSEALQKAAADADTVRLLAGLLAAEAAAAPPPAPAVALPAGPGGSSSRATSPSSPGEVLGGGASGAASSPSPSYSVGASPPALLPGGSNPCSSASVSLREGCLRALGSLCLNRDDSRTQLLEAKVLRHIVRSLEDPCECVRAAAAHCVRALSRCVRTLRGGLMEGGGELAPVLVGLLGDSCVEVQASAAAALCNLVLDFSSAKSAVLAAGGLSRLVALTSAPQALLRHRAVWALANMLYRATGDVRTQLMQALPWPRLRQLLSDPEPPVVEQSLVLLRNLAMGDRTHIAAALKWAVTPPPPAAPSALTMPSPPAGLGATSGTEGPGGGSSSSGGEGVTGSSTTTTSASSGGGSGATVSSGSGTSSTGGSAGLSGGSGCEGGGCGEELLALLQHHIEVAAAAVAAEGVGVCVGIVLAGSGTVVTAASHALYTVANLLTGGGDVKDAVASRVGLLTAMAAHLAAEAGELALPAVWCAINLTWPAGGPGSEGGPVVGERDMQSELEAVAARCHALTAVGGADRLGALQRSHPSRDVQERARTALEQLRRGARVGGQEGAVSGVTSASQ